jgi:transposase
VLRGEIERESARLALVKQQVKALEAAWRQELAEGKQPLVAQLAQLRAIGPKGAWVLVKEVFGWRSFANRRELAGCLGLAPTAYDSGGSQIEQGISKARNKRARTMLVELAWSWLRLQPDSVLTQWFNRRFAGSGKRMRRVGIVALARRLAIALWRCGATSSTARSQPGPRSSRPPPEVPSSMGRWMHSQLESASADSCRCDPSHRDVVRGCLKP